MPAGVLVVGFAVVVDSIVHAVESLLPEDIVRFAPLFGHAAAKEEGVSLITGVEHDELAQTVPFTGQPQAKEAHNDPPKGLEVASAPFVVADPKIVVFEWMLMVPSEAIGQLALLLLVE